MKYSVLALSVATLISGCSLAPSYQRPATPVAEHWETQRSERQLALPAWQDYFNDAELKQLIHTALENNRDLRVAALNVEAFQALYRIQRSELFPNLGVDASGSRQRLPGSLSPTGQSTINSQYGVTVGLSTWELDFFGRIRSLQDQALQQYFATEQAKRSAELSLIAGVANAWFNLLANQQLTELAQHTLDTYQDSLRITERSYEAGIATALELNQSKSAVNTAKVAIAQAQLQLKKSQHALQQLVGVQAPLNLQTKRTLAQIQLPEVEAGLPAELLRNRPDILQAEHALQAANANIGAARAAFFPSISLTANAGTLSPDLSGLFDGGSGSWLFQPRINLPIFTAGRLKANLNYSEIQKDINVAQYEQAIQAAFREVADGLTSRTSLKQQLTAQQQLVSANQEYFRLADLRYREGIDNQLTLLDAQRQLFSSQQQHILTQLQQLTSEVELYKALGGDMQAKPATVTTSQTNP
ncbi:multidrug transporter [Thiopseudomonas alkaliphila]|uniref:Multidrug transporter n=1 Tax=Thiopseudomonas alkaliphila TaxID=1697053 RepID=A0A0K1XBW0_9GAMM|nr:efflux transporter outer membrane subunit [Thiopseudomonas alkaliphila]AKX58821.1 multidrug transporter [Thiopseudomonas alkaliphila]